LDEYQRKIEGLKKQKELILNDEMLPRPDEVMPTDADEVARAKAEEVARIDAQITELESAAS
jgi:hypothetical protein